MRLSETLTPKQAEAWALLSDHTRSGPIEVLYGGAAGGGKSFELALWQMVSAAEYQGSRWLMGRAVLKTLKETTLATFFDVAKAQVKMEIGKHYTYNAQTGTIHIGASTILTKDLAFYPTDPNFDELGSLELTGAGIDECNQTVVKAKDIVVSRIRYKLDEFRLKPKCFLTCNPAKNWVYDEFFDPWRRGTLPPNRAFVQAFVTDNPAFAPIPNGDGTFRDHPYVESLKRLKGPDRERLLMGNWDYEDSEWVLIPVDLIYSAYVNATVPEGEPALIWDVAGPGSDRSVLALFSGMRCKFIRILEGEDVNEQAAVVAFTAKQEKVPAHRIVVDATGIGTGPAQLLRGCLNYKGGEKPVKNDDFRNFKSECSFELADYFADGLIAIDTEDHKEAVVRELGTLRQWKGDQDGKIQVTPKQEVRKELSRSPDIGDIFVMRMALEVKGNGRLTGQAIKGKVRRWRKQAFREEMNNRWG